MTEDNDNIPSPRPRWKKTHKIYQSDPAGRAAYHLCGLSDGTYKIGDEIVIKVKDKHIASQLKLRW